MDYGTVVTLTQLLALFFFIVMSALVVTYVCWPGNKDKFTHAAQRPLEHDSVNQIGKG